MPESFDDHSLGSGAFYLLNDIRRYGLEQAKAKFMDRRSRGSWYRLAKELQTAGINLNEPLPTARPALPVSKHYVVVQLMLPADAPAALWSLQQSNELYLSPNARLSGPHKMAYLDSQNLAAEYIDAVTPRISRRYGCNVELKVIECECRQHEKTERIINDSALVRARLATGILVPNQKP